MEGIAAYGFDLGGAGSTWNLKGVDYEECEAWRPSWVGEDLVGEIEDGSFDYESAITGWLAKHEVKGVEVQTYGMLTAEDAMGLMLVTWRAKSSGAHVASLGLPDLLERRKIGRWDERLAEAIEVLNIQPLQPHPMWLLTQQYG